MKVLTCTVTLNDSLDKIFRYIGIVSKQLLSVFRQTIAVITERRIVIEGADTWVKTYTLNDVRCIKTFYLSVGV